MGYYYRLLGGRVVRFANNGLFNILLAYSSNREEGDS